MTGKQSAHRPVAQVQVRTRGYRFSRTFVMAAKRLLLSSARWLAVGERDEE